MKKNIFWITIAIVLLFLVGCLPQNPPRYLLTLVSNPVQGGILDGGGKYKGGESVQLTATAAQNWQFENWMRNGFIISEQEIFDYIVPAYNHELVANFSPLPNTFSLTLDASPVGAGEVFGGGQFTDGATITLTATPSENWRFDNWTKDGMQVSDQETFVYTMPATDATLIANFISETTYTLTLEASPTSGGTVSGGGEYAEGVTVTITATANEDWSFVNWTRAGVEVSTEREYDYTMPATAATLTANFAPSYTLTLEASPTSGGTVSGGGEYAEGVTVTITATANEDWSFVNWTRVGVEVSKEREYDYTMPATAATLTANFAPSYTLTLEASPTSGGTVSGGGEYAEGVTVTITATANEDWSFVNWTRAGVEVSKEREYDYTMPATAATLTANFLPFYTLSLVATPSQAGQVAGEGIFAEGATTTLTTTPTENWRFVNWTKDGVQVSDQETFVYTMPAETATLTANFVWDVPVVKLSDLLEDTQYEMYDGTDYGYWLVYIHPVLIAQLPNDSDYGLYIDGDVYEFEKTNGDIYAMVPTNEHDEQDIKENGVLFIMEDQSVSISALIENTQYEMYDATDFGYWQLYIFPEQIFELPDTGTYQLRIGTNQYLFEKTNGDIYATVPTNEHDVQDIKINGKIRIQQ